jgi:tRNA threonylcarbamoyladenosine biosynthesis protein TsaE
MAGSGLVICLDGDLGSGKTCLTQGFAAGLGVAPGVPVTSPTYTLMNHYRGRLELFHFDFYRIAHPDELIDLDFEEIAAGSGVAVVEWADLLLGAQREGLHVALAHSGADTRTIRFRACGAAAGELLAALARDWPAQGECP